MKHNIFQGLRFYIGMVHGLLEKYGAINHILAAISKYPLKLNRKRKFVTLCVRVVNQNQRLRTLTFSNQFTCV